MSNTDAEKEAQARLRRIETRVTNMARWFGFDATKPPVNDPTQPVFVDKDEGYVVYATPAATVGDVLLALRRSNVPDTVDEVPLIINGMAVGAFDPHVHTNYSEELK